VLAFRVFSDEAGQASSGAARLDHDDFGLNQSKIIKRDRFNELEQDAQISLCNLRKLDCAGKPVAPFPHLAPVRTQVRTKVIG
jgi:hypothetical protein